MELSSKVFVNLPTHHTVGAFSVACEEQVVTLMETRFLIMLSGCKQMEFS